MGNRDNVVDGGFGFFVRVEPFEIIGCFKVNDCMLLFLECLFLAGRAILDVQRAGLLLYL